MAGALAEAMDCDQSGVDLEVVICARAAVLGHVTFVLGDLVPRTRTRHADGVVPVALVEDDPLDALGRILHTRLRPAQDHPPSELLDLHRKTDPVTAHWARAGRFALTADQSWFLGQARPLTNEQAWHVVGEVACVAEVIAVLDRGLQAAAADRPDVQVVLASTAGLRVAAQQAAALTAGRYGASSAPTVRDADAMAQALALRSGREPSTSRSIRRLTTLLGKADELTPHQIRAGTVVARDLAILAARDAVDPTGRKLLRELGDLSCALHAASKADGGEFAQNTVEHRVLGLQLRELRAVTAKAFATRSSVGAVEATRVACHLPDLVDVLARKANTQVELTRWALPDRREDAQLPYAFASVTDTRHRPRLLDALAEAREAARALAVRIAPEVTPSPLGLALAAMQRRPDLQRPRHPASAPPRRGHLGGGMSLP